jgi:hypothetical protein
VGSIEAYFETKRGLENMGNRNIYHEKERALKIVVRLMECCGKERPHENMGNLKESCGKGNALKL